MVPIHVQAMCGTRGTMNGLEGKIQERYGISKDVDWMKPKGGLP